MQDSIFRFVNVRPPQRKDPLEGTIDYIDPYDGDRYTTAFHKQLASLVDRDQAAARTLANEYILKKGVISHLESLRNALAGFDRAVARLGVNANVNTVEQAIQKVLDGQPPDVVARNQFREDREDLADSITAAFFAHSLPIARLSPVIRGLRLCELVERIANADPDVSVDGGVARVLRATIVIPFESTMDQTGENSFSTVLQPLYRLWNSTVGDHFYTTFAAERNSATQYGYVDEGVACYVYTQQISDTTPLYRLWNSSVGDHLYTTSSAERDGATEKYGYVDEGIACYVYTQPVSEAIPLYRLWNPGVSDHFYSTSSVERDNAVEVYGYAPEGVVCYVCSIPLIAGAVKPSGVSDLLVVRQTLRRYELGEIAHVENALKGEYMERTHRSTQTTETLLLQETETTTEQEHDLQSTDRFEWKSEASKVIQENTQAQAGVTVTATYGTVNGSVSANANGQFAFERSIEDATHTATTYAHDVVEQTRNRVQERTLTRRSTRTVLEVEETAKHGLDNKKGTDHIVGIYRWLDKVYEAQVVNYGRRLMLEFSIPEPAAYYRILEKSGRLSGLTKKKPEKPVVATKDGNVDLQPKLITWPDVQKIAAQYETTDIQPPPSEEEIIGASIEVPFTDKDYEKDAAMGFNRALPALGGTKVSGEIKIARGYRVKRVTWSGASRAYIRKNPLQRVSSTILEDDTSVTVGAQTGSISGEVVEQDPQKPLLGFIDTLPVAVITSAAGLVVTFRAECERTNELFQEWQVKMYDTIMAAYLNQVQQYEEEAARLDTERGIQISSRPSEENRKIEQIELKRAAISILTGQHFDAFGAVYEATPNDGSKSPRIAFTKAAVEGDIVQYFEQVFEWHNMTYIFYPYFWGRKNQWSEVLSHESTDPLFEQFLQAGYARIQVPVRLSYEAMVLYFLSSSKIWQEAEDAAVTRRYLPLVEEIRNQTGDDFTPGVGTVAVLKDATAVSGKNTQFTENDIDREIRIQSKVYRISSVQSATAITLAKPYKAQDTVNAAYSLGPKLVGPPWEVRLPTTLVMIDKPGIVLPSWPED